MLQNILDNLHNQQKIHDFCSDLMTKLGHISAISNVATVTTIKKCKPGRFL